MTTTGTALDWITQPALARLFLRTRSSLESSGGDLSVTISLQKPTDEERQAIAGLLGQWSKASTLRVRLCDLDDSLRNSAVGYGLIDLLEHIGDPLRDRPSERAELHSSIKQACEAAHKILGDEAWVRDWTLGLRKDGWLTRLAKDDDLDLLGLAADVLSSLPVPGGVLLATLASTSAGGAHALDPGRLATLVLRGLAMRFDLPLPQTSSDRRSLWGRAGVRCDDVSSHALCIGLRVGGSGPLARMLHAAAESGLATHVTLAQLDADPAAPLLVPDIFVCENPQIVGLVQHRLGPYGAPLICSEGQPSLAFRELLGRIPSTAAIHCHGDFDWGGVRILGALLRRTPGAVPWRMGVNDYQDAVLGVGRGGSTAQLDALTGVPAPTPWEPALGYAMTQSGVAVHEELVANTLIADLSE